MGGEALFGVDLAGGFVCRINTTFPNGVWKTLSSKLDMVVLAAGEAPTLISVDFFTSALMSPPPPPLHPPHPRHPPEKMRVRRAALLEVCGS